MEEPQQSQTKAVDPVEQAWDKVREAQDTFVHACRQFVSSDLKSPRSGWENGEWSDLLNFAAEAGAEVQMALYDASEIGDRVREEAQTAKAREHGAFKGWAGFRRWMAGFSERGRH